MTSRRTMLVAVAGVVGAGLAGSPVSAQPMTVAAAGDCVVEGVRPKAVVVGLATVTPTWKPVVSGCTPARWSVSLPHGLGTATSAAPERSLPASKLKNSWAGSNTVRISVTVPTPKPPVPPTSQPIPTRPPAPTVGPPQDPDPTPTPEIGGASSEVGTAAETTTGTATFTLRRRSTWGSSFTIRPQQIDAGKKLTVSGKLRVADWSTDAYVAHRGRAVRLQFRSAGSTTWKSVATARTTRTGSVSASVKATKDGAWRWSFAGTATTSSVTTAADYVEVITAQDRRVFRNCDAMNATYPHGVGRTGAVDVTSGADPVTNFTRNTHLYKVNKARDRDEDGIACERH